MFGVGGGEIIVILLVALIVLGPDKLPSAVRKAGQVLGEVRKVSDGFQAEMRTAMLDTDPSRRPQAPPPRAVPPAEPELFDDDLSDGVGPGDPPVPPGGDAGTPT